MSLPYPPSISVAFGRDQVDPYIETVPVPSQEGITPGRASWETGFVALNMTSLTAGGIPPFGSDMNGVLNYLSANLVWLAAGGTFKFNQDIVDNSGGYHEGAIIRSDDDPSIFFYSKIDDNEDDPNDDPTNWIQFSPLSTVLGYFTDAPTIGSHDNVAVANDIGAYDVDTTAGDIVFTGITAGRDGQILTLTNTGANLLTLAALNGGSLAANQFRFAADLSVPPNDSITVRYLVAIGKWIKL